MSFGEIFSIGHDTRKRGGRQLFKTRDVEKKKKRISYPHERESVRERDSERRIRIRIKESVSVWCFKFLQEVVWRTTADVGFSFSGRRIELEAKKR